jgi:hypothetical protein
MAEPASPIPVNNIPVELMQRAKRLGLSWGQIMQIVSILLSVEGQPLTLATLQTLMAEIQAVLTPPAPTPPPSAAKGS